MKSSIFNLRISNELKEIIQQASTLENRSITNFINHHIEIIAKEIVKKDYLDRISGGVK